MDNINLPSFSGRRPDSTNHITAFKWWDNNWTASNFWVSSSIPKLKNIEKFERNIKKGQYIQLEKDSAKNNSKTLVTFLFSNVIIFCYREKNKYDK